MSELDALQARIGYRFHDVSLLETALSHPSLGRKANNQRLEFLGDSVLGAAIARMVYTLYPQEAEGELARRLSALVRSETLAQVARGIGLGGALSMTQSEAQAGGRDNPTNLEDACEALIGALFLDGGFEAAESFVQRHWKPLTETMRAAPKDAKTALQEWAQGIGLPVPAYGVVESSGPAHAPQFTVEVSLPGHAPERASAGAKRAAEQLAAQALLQRLRKT